MKFAKDQRVKTAQEYILEHLASSLSLAQIAQMVGVTAATLTTLFKKECDKTVTQYITEERLGKASQLLATTSLPIKEIAACCGFKTVPHFSRLFKEKYGMPPAKYRSADSEQRKPPIMDVVFEQPTKNQIEYINPGLLEQIVVIGFTLAQGPIRELDSEERFSFLCATTPFASVIMREEPDRDVVRFEKQCLANLELLRAHAAKGHPVRIWCALAHAEPLCEFAFLCDVLSEYHCPVYVIDHPDDTANFFGSLQEDYAPFLELSKPLVCEELERWALLWRKLKEENAPLRVRENGTLRSAPIDYYDDRMKPWLPTEWGGVACAEWIAANPMGYGDRDIDPGWYQFRLRTMIEEGIYTIVPVITDEDRVIIRHHDAPNHLTMNDLLLIAKALCPHTPPFERPKHLPVPQIWVLLSAKGYVYTVPNDDIEALLFMMKERSDTVITKWVTLWSGPGDILPPVDIPSFAARQRLLKLDNANSQTSLLLRGENQLIEKTLAETMS